MERSSTLGSNEGKHAIRHISGTDNPDLNAFKNSSSFAYFDDIQSQRFLETKQPPFSITKHSTFQCLDHYDTYPRKQVPKSCDLH